MFCMGLNTFKMLKYSLNMQQCNPNHSYLDVSVTEFKYAFNEIYSLEIMFKMAAKGSN